jgi:hypothetical protein
LLRVLCIDDELQPYQLLVSGNSGCNHFMEGRIKRATADGRAGTLTHGAM